MSERPLHVPGFRFGGWRCGIKPSGGMDLGLILADRPVPAAAVFTQNQIFAAPVAASRAAIQGGRAQAVIVNSGNANACTGAAGVEATQRTVAQLAGALGCAKEHIQVASTGVIGVPLPVEKITDQLDEAVRAAAASQASADEFGDAICTTDRFPKGASRRVQGYTVSVFAKGAGMIAPNMATMLAYAVTDAPIDSGALAALWRRVIDQSFNAVMVDGDTSTNDTAVIMAGGRGEPLAGQDLARFEVALLAACQEAAVQLVEDGEGARCVVELWVRGARSSAEARSIAQTIALSPLCKTAFFGADPNWGRIIAAAGRSAASLEPERLHLTLRAGEHAVPLFAHGVPLDFDHALAVKLMRSARFGFDLDVGAGESTHRLWTCDLGHNYVTLNAEYTT